MTPPRTPAHRDADAKAVTPALRYDYTAEGAAEAIRPTLASLATVLDRIARKRQQRTDDTDSSQDAA